MGGLSDQIKTPYISIRDESGNVLASTENYGEVGIVSFEYEFNDEDEDICTIRLQTNNPLAFDNLKIDRTSLLYVRWGYLNGIISDTAIIAVRDLTSKYGKEVIYTELECTDLLNYLQVSRADDVNKGRPIDYIISQCLEKYNIIIKDGEKVIYSCGKEPSGQAPWWYTREGEEAESFRPFSPYPPEDFGESVPDEKKGFWFTKKKDNNLIENFFTSDKNILSANRSVFAVIQGMLKDCPKGPWFVTGRGDTLLIHNRDFIQKPYRYYKYKEEPGYLIDFYAKTKYENFNKAVISYDYLDPKNLKFYDLNAYRDDLLKARNIKEIFSDKKLTKEQFDEEIKDYIDLMKAYKIWHTTKKEGAYYTSPMGITNFFPSEEDRSFVKVGEMSTQDKTRVELPSEHLKSIKGEFNPLSDDPILRVTVYSRPIELVDDTANFIKNEQRMLEMDKEEGKGLIEGDPFLQSEMIVMIDGIHNQHKGSYYIKKCKHTISKDGYKTQFDGIKVIPDNKIKTLTQITEDIFIEGDAQHTEEFYNQEQMIFGEPVILKTKTLGPPLTSTSSPGLPSRFEYVDRISIDELYEKSSDDDEFIDKLLKLRETNTTVEPNVEDK